MVDYYTFGVYVGFKHIRCDGNTCPDKHLSPSDTSMQPRFSLYSPTKHHVDFLEEMEVCIGFCDVDASGSLGLRIPRLMVESNALFIFGSIF